MKILHCADIHLGSKMDSRLPGDKADERKAEVRKTFSRIISYAKSEGVKVIMLSGDVFDSDRPVKKDKEFFYSAVKNNPQIDFLYLRGNHDVKESYFEKFENLKTFGSEWTAYTYGDAVISGIELSPENKTSFHSTLRLEKDKLNIVMLHGDEGMGVNLTKLREKNIDYLALGHIHEYRAGRLDSRGVWCYSGCPEGRGFDEAGEKGFVLLDVGEKISPRFIPFACREIIELDADLSDTSDEYTALEKIKSLGWSKQNIVRLNLTGEIDYSNETLQKEVEKQLEGSCYFISVKDKTLRKFNAEEYSGDLSLRGEFVREVLSSDLDAETRQRVIYAGLSALAGREENL